MSDFVIILGVYPRLYREKVACTITSWVSIYLKSFSLKRSCLGAINGHNGPL